MKESVFTIDKGKYAISYKNVYKVVRVRQGVITSIETGKEEDMVVKEKEEQAKEVPTLTVEDVEVEEIVRMPPRVRTKVKIEKAQLAEWVKKVTITIDDKNDNDPISIVFEGEWTGRDLNLASKSLLLEYGVYLRNR